MSEWNPMRQAFDDPLFTDEETAAVRAAQARLAPYVAALLRALREPGPGTVIAVPEGWGSGFDGAQFLGWPVVLADVPEPCVLPEWRP